MIGQIVRAIESYVRFVEQFNDKADQTHLKSACGILHHLVTVVRAYDHKFSETTVHRSATASSYKIVKLPKSEPIVVCI